MSYTTNDIRELMRFPPEDMDNASVFLGNYNTLVPTVIKAIGFEVFNALTLSESRVRVQITQPGLSAFNNVGAAFSPRIGNNFIAQMHGCHIELEPGQQMRIDITDAANSGSGDGTVVSYWGYHPEWNIHSIGTEWGDLKSDIRSVN